MSNLFVLIPTQSIRSLFSKESLFTRAKLSRVFGSVILVFSVLTGMSCESQGAKIEENAEEIKQEPMQEVVAQANLEDMERVTQTLVAPPFVPQHSQIANGAPKIVQVRMTIEEKEIEVEPGVFKWVFTYNGSVPGPLIIVHQNDYVELTLVNPTSNQLLHNVDFHASTGALGGAGLTSVGPGQEVVLRWKATKIGTFIYHCAPGGVQTPWHVVNGMNGALMVLPRDGLKDGQGNPLRYDLAYYVGEQDFYLPKDAQGKYKRYSSASSSLADDLVVMRGLVPSHVVFNGKVRTAHWRKRTQGQSRRNDAHRALSGQSPVISTPDRRPR